MLTFGPGGGGGDLWGYCSCIVMHLDWRGLNPFLI
jgi:hypothetical protein